MANIFLKVLFSHWLAFLNALQQFFLNYTPRPLLSTVFPDLIEGGVELSPIVLVPPNRDPSDYINTVDLAMMCFAPAIPQPPLTMNLSCSVDRPDYDLLDDVSSTESSHSYSYVFLDIPVWGPAVPREDVLMATDVEDDEEHMNMTPYGARGLSFCPVLVAIVYIHSLLHLYMLLMIPSLINHWFEDILVYESLDPARLLHFSWFFHTSLWTAPWHLFRHGVRKAIPCLYRYLRRVTHKSTQPSIPRIVLIRVDGEAVPVNFSEDQQVKVDVGTWSSLETANLEVGDGQAVTFEGGDLQKFTPIPSLVCGGNSCVETECKGLSMHAVSHQGGVAKAEDGIGSESLASEFPDSDPQVVVNDIPQAEISPENGNKHSHSVENDIFPNQDIFAVTMGDVDGETNFEYMAFPQEGGNDVYQGGTDCHEEREEPEQNQAFSSWSLVDHRGPDGSETSSENVVAPNSSVASLETSAPAKNVRFAVCDNGAADCRQASLSTSHIDECSTCPGPLDSPEDVGPVEITVAPFNLADAISPGQVIQPVPSMVPSEDGVEEIGMLAQYSSPSFTEKPIVNLPSLVATREDVRFVEMDPMIPAALIEDVATRSPIQILCPIVPAVVLNVNCIIKAEEQGWIPPGAGKLDQDDFVRKLNQNDRTARRGMLDIDIVAPSEDGPFPRSLSIEGWHAVYSPIADTKPPFGDDGTPITLPTVCENGMPAANTSLVANMSPSDVGEVPQNNELQARILYETPPYSSGGKGLLLAIPESLEGPDAEDHANFLVAGKSDNMAVASDQPVDHSFVVATELPTTKPSEREIALSCKEAGPFSMISEDKKIGKLDDRKSCEADNIPWGHQSTISKPPPERTLSGSMHAPSESLSISQANNCIDPISIIDEAPPLWVPLSNADDGKASTNTVTEKRYERGQDLSGSIHAPKRISKEMPSSVPQSRDEVHRHHSRSVTNSATISDRKPVTEPCPPNWAAMPDVVNAFRMFKEGRSGDMTRRVSSIADCTNRGPMVGVVGQKGVATSSLNNTSATADIQSRWMHGNRLLLVRDLVPSDPADFNLRTCTNLRASKIHDMNAIPVQQVLYPGVLDISPYAFQGGITPLPVHVNANLSSVVQTGVQREQSISVPRIAEMEPMFGSQLWTAYRGRG